MKRKLVSILTALALCLSLLPGTAWAVEPSTGVTFANESNNVTLTDGKFYVAAAENKGITEWTEGGTPTGAYLSYSGTTLTVHGAFETTAVITVNSDLTITGGAGSSLNVTAPYGYTISLGSGSVTLDGSVDFTANDNSASVIMYASQNSTGTFAAADSYSGDIVLRSGGGAPAVYGVPLDVQNSGSITIVGMMTSIESAVLSSKGKVSITSSSGPILPRELTIKGANVELINNNNSGSSVFSGQSLNIEATGNVLITNKNSGTRTAPALMGSAVISAGGDVTISSNDIPAEALYGSENSLSVKNAKNVSITGSSGTYGPFFSVPVTFEKCGSVTVTDSGSGDLMKAGVTVTSDKPWTAKTGEKTVTLPSGEWHYGGDTTDSKNQYGLSLSSTGSAPTCWKAGEGWIYYEPAADGSSPNKLTLDNATYGGKIGASNTNDLTVTAKGSNQIHEIGSTGNGSGSVTVKTEGGGTLNALVYQRDTTNQKLSTTVYGKVELTTGYALGPNLGNYETSMTIAPGAEATIPSNANLSIFDTTYLTNNGTIVNNGTVSLQRAAAENATSETVKGLGLTGTGSVNVVTTGADGSTATDTYTNSGTKFLTPAGTLDLSSNTGEDKLEDKGYKWEVTKETDGSGNEIITSATLTLAPGFNATSVTLPDAAVTIVTEGESRIGTLTAGSSPNNAKLTFSGTGPLTVNERINISGGDGNIITVNENATVIANGGIFIGASGGVNSTITVNGTLTAKVGGEAAAISAGSVAIGDTGVLDISGKSGVQLNSMPQLGGNQYKDLFTVTGNGRFTANCSEYNVKVVAAAGDKFPDGTTAEGAINLTDEYLPDDCKPVLNGGAIDLIRISTNQVYKGPLTIHKNHTWKTTWAHNTTNHWHPCEFAGCTEKQPGSEAAHFYRSCVCTVCGYRAPAGTPDSGSGGSGGSGSSSYAVTVEKTSHGEVASDRRTASQGDTVTLTVTPDSGYGLSALTVTDSRGNAIALTHQGGGTYRFTMPGRAVTVRAAFASSACTGGADCPSRAFSDLDTSKWYHEAVDYVLKNGLMSGYGSGLFGPDDNLTRAQFTQILHNKEGRPVVNYLLQYSDVADGAWYTEAIRWATSQGVVNGYGNGRFGPNDNITREQLAVMLWRYAGNPAAAGEALHFTDADQAGGYALDALGWAVENGILNGKGGGILDPKGLATRAQATQMLKNFLKDA